MAIYIVPNPKKYTYCYFHDIFHPTGICPICLEVLHKRLQEQNISRLKYAKGGIPIFVS